MDPFTAAILVGAATSMIGMQQANSNARAQARAQRQAQDQAVENQNALVEEGYNKRKNAMGLGQNKSGGGLVASQTGGVLTSVTDGNQASGL